MLKFGRLLVIGAVLVLMARVLPVSQVATGVASDCTVAVANTVMHPMDSGMVEFDIHNGSNQSVVWIRISRPSVVRLTGVIAQTAGWSDETSADSTTLRGGSLDPGGDYPGPDYGRLQLEVRAQVMPGAGAWVVEVSDDVDGANPVVCTGSLGMTVSGLLGPNEAVGVSNVGIEGVTKNSADVVWESEAPMGSGVHYGTSSGYGLTSAYSNDLVLNHRVRLVGLKPDTVYHFLVVGMNDDWTMSYSIDNTFITLKDDTPSSATPAAISTPSLNTGPAADGVAPVVSLSTKLANPYKMVPEMVGVATDDVAVSRVEYSVDGGKNWSLADRMAAKSVTTGTGKKKKTTTDARNVEFSFTPVLIEDGDYVVVVRATDSSGNAGVSGGVKLVIDRLPPRFGAVLVAVGGQEVRPDGEGAIRAVAGVDESITLNAVGGATSVAVMASRGTSKAGPQSFALRQEPASGLWQGVMSFRNAGDYRMSVRAVDGAGNVTTSALPHVIVMEPARVVGSDGKGVKDAKVTLYYQRPDSKDWVMWDAGSWGQNNSLVTSDTGSFGFVVPAGTYYLKVEGAKYRTVMTRTFTTRAVTPLSTVIKLQERPSIGIGAWRWYVPWPTLTRVDVQMAGVQGGGNKALVGKTLPNFSLPTTTGGTVTAVGLLGKPTVVSVVATWAPATAEQLPVLAKLKRNGQINVTPLVMGERVGKAASYMSRSGYELPVSVDADATLSGALGVASVPTHVVLDRHGKVRQVLVGVKSEQELLDALGR